MDKNSISPKPGSDPNKIYVVFIGSAPMSSQDALMLSLERFQSILSSDSAKDRFETTLRTVKSTLPEVNEFIHLVYAQRDPRLAVTMKGFTLIIEINMSKHEFLECVYIGELNTIYECVTAVGAMPAKTALNQKMRDYTVFPVKYANDHFVKISKVW